MKTFATLYKELDGTTSDNEKINILTDYLKHADPKNAAWIIFFLSGKKIDRNTTTSDLKKWCREETNTPEWLYKECYRDVGDTAETIALLLPREPTTDPLEKELWEVVQDFQNVQDKDKFIQEEYIKKTWKQLPHIQKMLFNKIITRAFRVGINKKGVAKSLARISDADEKVIKQRLMGDITPTEQFYHDLLAEKDENELLSKPYPFYLATKLETLDDLHNEDQYIAEYKWDGIRIQLVKRKGTIEIWSRRGDILTQSFPDLKNLAHMIPGSFVLDGELVIKKEDIKPFSDLQKRLGRKNPSPSLMEKHPASMIAYDLLEKNRTDIREQPLKQRRKQLESTLSGTIQGFHVSQRIPFNTWQELETKKDESRKHNAEGVMIKKKDSIYRAGRKKGGWWKWKLPPHTIDAVLMYAQPGRGRRANLYTDYTFGVWDGDKLVPIAKAYSGLTDNQLEEMTQWIRKHTTEKYGPVREVEKEKVFEIAFESMQESNRHKSGVSLRFPRIQRWRKDKDADEAETLERAKQYLET